MRVGWILADTSIINKVKSLGWLSSGGGVCNTMGHIVRSYIQLGYFQKIIDATRKEFGERARLCDEILKGSKAYSYEFPLYGYFFWLKLADNVNLEKLKSAMLKEDCHAFFGDFLIHDEAGKEEKFQFLKRRIRLCFVRYSKERVLEGFYIMKNLIEESVEITKF
jgi:DNA-binding transcriptional MocR family regulator